MELSRMY